MKKLLCCCLIVVCILKAKADDFYYYKNEKLKLELNTRYLYVLCNLDSKEKLNERIKAIGEVTKFGQDIYYKRLITTYRNSPEWMTNGQNYFAEIKLSNGHLNKEELLRIFSSLKDDPSIMNVSFHFSYNGSDHFAVTDYVWVNVKNEEQIPLLATRALEINYSILGQNPFMKDWIMLGANKNASLLPLQGSQYLYETGLFAHAEPDILAEAKTNCVNDSLFALQWGFNNTGIFRPFGFYFGPTGTGTAGIDTRICNAWGLTTGSSSVDIAIIDQGFENNHPDLNPNLENNGYDAYNGTTPTAVYGPHGTACAGIAAAKGDNTTGVSGVARNSQLMSVSLPIGILGSTYAQYADAFNWSRINGAEVISNSWSVSAPGAMLDASIDLAFTQGRGGLGCVVLFAAGNENGNVGYPANSNDSIIVAGALSPCAQRKSPTSCDGESWGSNYGATLDVMAPGVVIATTDMQGSNGYNNQTATQYVNTDGNYDYKFNGTSSACPHVAGIAALILSANPCLTQSQVQNIIQRTAQKVGTYNYNTSTANGTWNNEMGYGLVNAEEAVIMAMAGYLQNQTITGVANYLTRPIIQAGHHVNPFITQGNFVTTSTSNVTINCSKFIEFKEGCNIQGILDAHIGSVGNCNTW